MSSLFYLIRHLWVGQVVCPRRHVRMNGQSEHIMPLTTAIAGAEAYKFHSLVILFEPFF